MELIYSLKIDLEKTKQYCQRFGYVGNSNEELLDFYNNLLTNHLFSWNGYFASKDSDGNPIYSYTFNEDV